MRVVFPLIGLAIVAACTTASTTMLNDNAALISAHDLGWGSASDVRKKVLVTAAQMAQARGYEYFAIVGAEDASKSGIVYLPGQSTTNTYGSAYCSGYWCSGNATSTTSGTAPHYVPYVQLGADVTVRFLHGSDLPEDKSGIYESAAILSSAK